MNKYRLTRDKDKFIQLIDDEIQRIALISLSQGEFEDRVIEYKKIECLTVQENEWFIEHCKDKYGFLP